MLTAICWSYQELHGLATQKFGPGGGSLGRSAVIGRIRLAAVLRPEMSSTDAATLAGTFAARSGARTTPWPARRYRANRTPNARPAAAIEPETAM